MEESRQWKLLEVPDSEAALPFCPSFSTYSSGGFTEIAAKVTQETSNDIDDDDEDFEFAFIRSDSDVTTDEIFCDDETRQIFPVFDRDLLIRDDRDQTDDNNPIKWTLRLPFEKLFIDDGEERDSPSEASSEADELESVPAGTYCVWRPKLVEKSPSWCKKSNSTGSASKRWKLRDLLHRRSNSDGMDSFVFLTPKNTEKKAGKQGTVEDPKENREPKAGKAKAKGVSGGGGGEKVSSASASAHEVFYVRNRAWKEGEKRKSYLPYRQDLVGFFANNVSGFGKKFPPF